MAQGDHHGNHLGFIGRRLTQDLVLIERKRNDAWIGPTVFVCNRSVRAVDYGDKSSSSSKRVQSESTQLLNGVWVSCLIIAGGPPRALSPDITQQISQQNCLKHEDPRHGLPSVLFYSEPTAQGDHRSNILISTRRLTQDFALIEINNGAWISPVLQWKCPNVSAAMILLL